MLAVPVGLDPPGESPASPCWGHPVGNDLNPCDGVRHLKAYTAPGRKFLPNGWKQMQAIPPRMNTFTSCSTAFPPIDSSRVVDGGGGGPPGNKF